MSTYRFYYPIQVRYGDLDPQWHVNNARFFTFIEAARFAYYIHLGLFDGKSFHDLETIIADVRVSYLASILLGQNIRVGVRISRLGNKSMDLEAQIEDQDSGKVLATCKAVTVAYDYRAGKSKPISDHWRQVISAFEGISPGPDPAPGSASK
ncbi:MAG: acyl-CoA thioesterase [Anaerolineae bacterium]|nr:acyl-CoA thioesterase [Anaerolineae bacterium]